MTTSVALIVPINLRALCVGVDDVRGTSQDTYGTADFARVAADFSRLPYLDNGNNGPSPVNRSANVSAAVLPPMFTKVSTPLPSGIHLHWSLPDAIARATSSSDGDSVRSAPNRWLVVRIATNAANPAAPVTDINAWVVQSDTLWDQSTANDPLATNALSIARLLNPLPDPSVVPNQPFLTVGRTFPYASWSETGAAGASPHTAFGYGDLSYASAYAMAPNVFGMYDPLLDLDLNTYPPATTTISYLVAGWYSSLDDDPLASLSYPAHSTYDEVLALIQNTFGWTFTPDTAHPLPSRTLCNGILTSISWDPQKRYLKNPANSDISVAIGNTTAEALSALLAAQPVLSGLQDVEGVLNALQLNLLRRIDDPDGLMQIEESEHQAQFGSSTSGTLWVIKPVSPGNSDGQQNVVVTGKDLLSAASTLQQPLPLGVGDALNELNALQQQADELQFLVDSYRRQIFADWYKYMLLEYSAQPPTPLLQATDIVNYLNDVILPSLTDILATQQPALATQISAQVAAVNTLLGTTYMLDSVRTPRYWSSNDPVLLLSGTPLSSFYRPLSRKSCDAAGNLLCRLGTQFVTSMQVTSPQASVGALQLPQLPTSPNTSNAVELAALMAEAFFLDPNQATVLAVAAFGSAAGNWWQQIQTAQQNLFTDPGGNTNITFSGTTPAPLGFQTWSSPWVPLLMEWEVNYYPLAPIDDEGSPTTYSPSVISSNYQLDEDGIDFSNINPPPATLPPLEVYQGFSLLTHNTEINIVNQINTFIKNYPDDPHVEELWKIAQNGTLPMMAQALGGFTQGLVMREQTLQLPVFDTLGLTTTPLLYKFSNDTIPAVVDKSNTSAPLVNNSYNPLRAGFMQISRIWLVDIYGQKIEVDPTATQVVRSSSLVPAGDDPGAPLIGLPPRIAQPSRLLFRWLSADNDAVEMNSDPATTPVFGWVLFNHLDDALAIYDADGNPLGSFNIRGPLWTGAPGNNATYNQPIQVAFADANLHLRDFALGIYNNPDAVGFLKDLLAAIDDTVTLVNPQNSEQFQAMSVLIGRPIALVRACLTLDLQGLPDFNQSWTELAAATSNSLPMASRDSARFTSVEFPVRLGDLANVNDGLIGYFIDAGSANDYDTFYAPASTQTSNGVVPPGPDQLLVSAAGAPVTLSILMDPRASIHATAGFVPVKELRIPPDMFSDALNNMSVTFLATPVLSTASSFSIPTPKEDGYVWSWLALDPSTGQWTTSPIAAPDLNAAPLTVQQLSEGWLQLSPKPLIKS